jgi:hypothetical protein
MEMKTFKSVQDLFTFAHENLRCKATGKKRMTKALVIAIMKEEKKSQNRQLAAAKLMLLFRYARSVEQEDLIYATLAEVMSKLKSNDLEFINYAIINAYDQTLKAMCWILKRNFGMINNADNPGLPAQAELLDTLRIGHYFKTPVRKVA